MLFLSINERIFLLSPLVNNAALSEVGLEIKADLKLNPRLAIHDIPVELTGEAIANCISQQNFSDATPEEFKIIYLYPAENKKVRTCIIETKPEHRFHLMQRGKVNINWIVCRVTDHVSVLQCYNCYGYGHIAKECKKNECCGKCADEHATKTCKVDSKNFKCVNCVAANSTAVNHSATDKANCPILRAKINRKISSINYG